MAETVKYIARQRFKYNGQQTDPGDEWTPAGSKHDNAIIRNKLVTGVRVEQAPRSDAANTKPAPALPPAAEPPPATEPSRPTKAGKE